MKIALTINGRPVEAEVAPRTNLADFLREHQLLTGTHVGCEHGICGACTVEIDGEIARSCITYAVSCDGATVRTIEDFDDDHLMARLRQAFTQEHALQCGYCTPGMLVAARDLVRRKARLTRDQIRVEMSGNLCRCTGYMGIVSAIERVMAETNAAPSSADGRARAWLGPAPGPQAATARASNREAPGKAIMTDAQPSVRPAPRPQAAGKRVRVTVGAIEERDGVVRLVQNFVLEHPRDRVWQLMSDPEAAARCMPGASLDGPPVDGKVKGRIDVKLGPVTAAFAGEGTVEQFPSEYRQVIEGRGGDSKSGSRVTGRVDYRLSPTEDAVGQPATRVDVILSYGLTGMLAQLGRSGIARDLARDMGERFANNIDARLRGAGTDAGQQAGIGAFGLMLRLLTARLRALAGRLLGR